MVFSSRNETDFRFSSTNAQNIHPIKINEKKFSKKSKAFFMIEIKASR